MILANVPKSRKKSLDHGIGKTTATWVYASMPKVPVGCLMEYQDWSTILITLQNNLFRDEEDGL